MALTVSGTSAPAAYAQPAPRLGVHGLPNDTLDRIFRRLPDRDAAYFACACPPLRSLLPYRADARSTGAKLDMELHRFELAGEGSRQDWLDGQARRLDLALLEGGDPQGALIAHLERQASEQAARVGSLCAHIDRRAHDLREAALSPPWLATTHDAARVLRSLAWCDGLTSLDLGPWCPLNEAGAELLPPSLEHLTATCVIDSDPTTSAGNLGRLPRLKSLRLSLKLAPGLQRDAYPSTAITAAVAMLGVCQATSLERLDLTLPPELLLELPQQLWQLGRLRELRVRGLYTLQAEEVGLLLHVPQLRELELLGVSHINAAARGLQAHPGLQRARLSGRLSSPSALVPLLEITQLESLTVQGFHEHTGSTVRLPDGLLANSRLRWLRLYAAGADDLLSLAAAPLLAAPRLELVKVFARHTTLVEDADLQSELRACALLAGEGWHELQLGPRLQLAVNVRCPYARTEAPLPKPPRSYSRPISISGRRTRAQPPPPAPAARAAPRQPSRHLRTLR